MEHGVEMTAKDDDDGSSVASDEGLFPPGMPGEKTFAEPKSLPFRTMKSGTKRKERDHHEMTREQSLEMVRGNQELNKVFEIAEEFFREDIGTGFHDDYAGTNIVDPTNIVVMGGTSDDFSKKLPPVCSINVGAQLQLLCMMKVLQSSSNFESGKRVRPVRYWLPTNGAEAVTIHDDSLNTSAPQQPVSQGGSSSSNRVRRVVVTEALREVGGMTDSVEAPAKRGRARGDAV